LFGDDASQWQPNPNSTRTRTEARPDALPIGLQIVGDHFQEALLLWIAATYEKETKFNTKRPSVFFTG
jgi:Asp-tRNA(Asn)/Glu-tRNA(Gln) amidotransferase A subunit family amidase